MAPPSSSTSATSTWAIRKWTDEEWQRLTRQIHASQEWADQVTGKAMIPQVKPGLPPAGHPAALPIIDNRRETAIRKFCQELADLLVAKQRAYGPKAITEAPGGPLNGLAVRIFDKHARFQNLVEDGTAGDGVADEALEDTSMDLCGYSVITTLVLRGAW